MRDIVRHHLVTSHDENAAVLGAGVWFLMPPPSAITLANAEKIQEGMTLEEVEAILGEAARDETTGETAFHFAASFRLREANRTHFWIADRMAVMVRLYPLGRVGDVIMFDNRLLREPLFDRVRQWIGLE